MGKTTIENESSVFEIKAGKSIRKIDLSKGRIVIQPGKEQRVVYTKMQRIFQNELFLQCSPARYAKFCEKLSVDPDITRTLCILSEIDPKLKGIQVVNREKFDEIASEVILMGGIEFED